MIVITYINYCLFFGPDTKAIQKMINELEENGYDLTCEDGDKDKVFSFLGKHQTIKIVEYVCPESDLSYQQYFGEILNVWLQQSRIPN